MTVQAAWVPPGKQTFVDSAGEPLAGGFVHHYIPGTTTRKDTWQDYDRVTLNANPIELDELGQCTIWGDGNYRQVLTDAAFNEIWDRNTSVGVQADLVLAAGSIFGLIIGNNMGNPTTQIDIALGQARDSTNSVDIALAGPLTKLLTAVWVAGTLQGGRDAATALAAGQSWHVFVIYNVDDDLVDVLFSQSPTAPNLPNGYTRFRRIASLPILGGDNAPPSGTHIPAFVQWGDIFQLYTGNNEFAAQSGNVAAQLKTFYVPLGIKVAAQIYAQITLGPAGAVLLFRATDPDLGVPPAFGGAGQFAQIRVNTDDTYGTDIFEVPTNTAGQLYLQVNNASALWAAKSIGWVDYRGQFG